MDHGGEGALGEGGLDCRERGRGGQEGKEEVVARDQI